SSVENYVPAELGLEAKEHLYLAPKRQRRRGARNFVLTCLTLAAVFFAWSKYVDSKGVWRYAQATWADIANAATTIAKTDIAKTEDSVPKAKPTSVSETPPSYTPAGVVTNLPEELPSPGRGLILSAEEVRYCVFQGRRLQYMRSNIKDDVSVQRFNGL